MKKSKLVNMQEFKIEIVVLLVIIIKSLFDSFSGSAGEHGLINFYKVLMYALIVVNVFIISQLRVVWYVVMFIFVAIELIDSYFILSALAHKLFVISKISASFLAVLLIIFGKKSILKIETTDKRQKIRSVILSIFLVLLLFAIIMLFVTKYC